MEAFGPRLKDARERRGVSLREIAAKTKISVAALEALERDDYSRLPGGIFSRAFIRAYSLEVGLDPESTVTEFLGELERSAREKAKIVQRPDVTAEDRAFLERQRKASLLLRVVLALVILAVIAVVAWQARAVFGR